MDANLDKIAQDLYGKIQTRFPNIRIGDEEANVLSKKQDIPRARFFEFEYEENGEEIGTVAITLDSDEGVVIEVSGDIVAKKHPGAFKFIRSFRQFAKDRMLNYDVKRMGKSNLDKRDYAFRSKVKDDMIMENKMFGTSKISYQDLGEATLVIKHSQPVNTELPAGRTMHIENIYIENALGERFRYPSKHINGARALAEHIKAGGNPYDGIGKHIIGLSEELASLRKFKNYVGRQEQLSEAMSDVTGKVLERIEAVKKEIHSLQRPAYYQQFAEAFSESDAQVIPEAVMDDWIDRLTIRTFNEELKSVFPYIYKLVDETQLPVVELNPDDLLQDSYNPNSVDAENRRSLDAHTRKTLKAKAEADGASDADKARYQRYLDRKEQMRNDYDARMERESYEMEATDTVEKDEKGNIKSWKHEGDWHKAAKKDPRGRVTNLSDKARRETEKKAKQPEDAFEDFVNSIVGESPEDAPLTGIFNPATREASISELNNIFQAELKAGPDDINFGKIKELIPDPEFAAKLDQTDKGLDARSAIEAILTDMAEENPAIGDMLQAGLIKFGGSEQSEPAAEVPPVTASPEAPAEPAAEVPPASQEQPAFAEDATSGATSSGSIATVPASLKAKLIKAVECGASPDTELDFGNRKMTLMNALQECGIDPASFGMKPKQSGIQEILKSIAGFWNKDATITEGNFTIGGTRTKQKVISGFKNGEYENATKEDVSKVLQMIDKMDPPSSPSSNRGDDLGRMKQMAGVAHATVDEGSAEEDFAQLMKDFQEKHGDADIEALIGQFKQGATSDLPQAPQQAPQQATQNQTGTIDGKPASYDDAMAKFRDIAGGMGFDGSSPEAMHKSIQSKLGGMMKGVHGQMPQGDVELPAGMGKLNPQAMMKGIMDKMPAMNEGDELASWLKIAGIK